MSLKKKIWIIRWSMEIRSVWEHWTVVGFLIKRRKAWKEAWNVIIFIYSVLPRVDKPIKRKYFLDLSSALSEDRSANQRVVFFSASSRVLGSQWDCLSSKHSYQVCVIARRSLKWCVIKIIVDWMRRSASLRWWEWERLRSRSKYIEFRDHGSCDLFQVIV